jgi:hypothetical protein
MPALPTGGSAGEASELELEHAGTTASVVAKRRPTVAVNSRSKFVAMSNLPASAQLLRPEVVDPEGLPSKG